MTEVERIGLSLKRVGNAPADLHLDGDGNLVLVRNAEAIGQHVRQRLMTYEGEWFLDTTAGVPWMRDLLGGAYDPVMVESVLKPEIMETDGVTEITAFSVRFDAERRGLSAFDIEVNTVYDQEVKA